MISNVLSYDGQGSSGKSLAAVLIACVLFAYLYHFRPRLHVLDVPSYSGRKTKDGRDFQSVILEATAKHRDEIFKLETGNHETVVLPARFIDEVKSISSDKLNLTSELYERMLGRFTRIGIAGHVPGFVNSIRWDLNRNLSSTLPTLLDEVAYAVQDSLGQYDDWTVIKPHAKALRMVAILTGRVFVGLPLSRDERWIESSIETTLDTFETGFMLWYLHWSIRPILALCIPKYWNIRRRYKESAALFRPILEQRKKDLTDPDFKPPVDLVGFFLKNVENKDYEAQAYLHSSVNIAAIHTTSMAVTHILYDLANHPEFIEPLRHEAEAVFAEANGVLDKNSLAKLRKMDSFMRESQRLSPPGIVSISRKVVADTVLSDGTVLPAGCLVACDSWSATRDPALWEKPNEFDGFRFEKLRAIAGNETKYHFVTTSPINMPFGHGAHACPGRFFVANEIKILFAYLILRYDVRLKPGCGRPKNGFLNIMIFPDIEGEIEIRSRV